MKCCLCDKEIPVKFHGWDSGNDAEPVVANGRCCDECNTKIVIPTRLIGMAARTAEKIEKALDKGDAK